MGVSGEALQRGDLVRLARHISGKLCLTIKKGGQDHMVLRQDNGRVRCFNNVEEAEDYCRRKNLVLENVRRKERVDLHASSFKRVTESDLRSGDTVTVRRHTSGSLCLLVERGELNYTLLREDGSIHLFDALGQVRLYCIEYGLKLLIPDDWDKPRNLRLLFASEHREPHQPSSLREARPLRRVFPTPKDEEGPLPLLDPEWGEAFVEAIKRQAARDLERLVTLTEERERLLEELSLELIRREALGNKSCLCRTCLHVLGNPVREVQEEIDEIWAWWGFSLGTTPADVVAGRWS